MAVVREARLAHRSCRAGVGAGIGDVDLGSATCVELRGVRYLLTAAHVLLDKRRPQPQPWPHQAISVIYRGEHGATNALIQRILSVGGGPEDDLDIALLELSAEDAEEIATVKKFLPEKLAVSA